MNRLFTTHTTMKSLALACLIFLFATLGTFGQNGPNAYDKLETASGVQVKDGQSQTAVRRRVSVVPKHYLPSPLVGEAYERSVANRPVVVENNGLVANTAMVRPRYADNSIQSSSPLSGEERRLMMAAGNSLRGYSTGDDLIDAFIVDSSRRYTIDPLLIYSQMSQESSFKRRALSNKGATGLMQLMPATARRMGVDDIYDPKQNIEGGVKYMRLLLNMFDGDVDLALAGYNAGEGAVIKYGYQIPPYNETQDYVRRISSRYRAIAQPTVARYVGETTNR